MRYEIGGVVAKRFRLDRELGQGGMGVVWAATHTVTRRQVALKMLHPRALSQQQRFLREARAASAVEHPNVVRIEDVFELDDGLPVIVMELLEGESLQARLERERKLPLAEAAAILLPVVSAVGAAHALGIVHRDLKPDNIFLARGAAGEERVKVLDFGIARLDIADELASRSSELTKTGALLGTPFYMSPEQASGERVDHRSDVWSLGIIAYQLLSGELPTMAETVGGVLKVVLTGRIPPIGRHGLDLPDDVEALIGRMLEVDPTGRPADLREVAEVLGRHADVAVSSFGAARSLQPGVNQADALQATAEWLDDRAAADQDATPAAARSDTVAAPPAAVTDRGPATTTAATAKPAARPPASRSLGVPLGLLLLACVGGTVWWLGRPAGGGGPDAAGTPSAPSGSAAASGVALREPKLGLRAIALYREPKGAGATASLSSASWWDAAAGDFARAVGDVPRSDAGAIDQLRDKARTRAYRERWLAEEQFCRAQALLMRGETDQAIALFRQAIAGKPAWAVAHVGLAAALSRASKVKEALAAAADARRLEPDWILPVSMVGRIHARANQLDEAIQAHRQALAMAPKDGDLLATLALTLHAARLDSEAQRYADAALAIDPDLVAVRLLLAERALERGDGKAALEEATRAAALEPRNASAHVARGDALALLGQRAEAMHAYRHAIELRDKSGLADKRDERLDVVRRAVAADKLPPPRTGAQASRTRPSPLPPRTRMHKPAGPPPRTACAPGDPLCSSL